MKICLNMIVKNEGERIVRALHSAAPWIDSWVIVDTGSTDDTKEKIVEFFKEKKIIGEIRDAPFVDWSQARNAALDWARKLRFAYEPQYILLMDADMELVVQDPSAFAAALDGAAVGWNVYQCAGTNHYQNTRFVRADQLGRYNGVTHEYFDGPTSGTIPMAVAHFRDHADGANRPGKFQRDIALLRKGIKAEPSNHRYWYYLAGSYRDAGKHDRAKTWFQRRVDAGGWDEERWHAQYCLAFECKALGDNAGFVEALIKAYEMRPSRAEPMWHLARWYREQGINAPATMCAEAILPLKKSPDLLFVDDYCHDVGAQEEISIAGYYVPHKRALAYWVTSELSLKRTPYQMAVENARTNLWYYYEPLSIFCPSFKWREVPFTPPANWIATNPSITNHAGQLYCNVRCVNYRIDENGCYLIRGTDGTANRENPINTRNFIMRCHDVGIDQWDDPAEVLEPVEFPVHYPLVIGFEDMRLISHGSELWASSTVRQLDADGLPEQVLTRISPNEYSYAHTDMHRMLRTPRECQKNWSPMPNMTWMYRMGHVVDHNGKDLFTCDTGLSTGHISGGSQLVRFGSGFLSVVHEARYIPGKQVRFYSHRFAQYDDEGRLLCLSMPFYFNDKGIEFCAGLAYQNGLLVISYGHKDCAARVATVRVDEVEKFLWLRTPTEQH